MVIKILSICCAAVLLAAVLACCQKSAEEPSEQAVNCVNLISTDIPGSVTEIGEGAFSGCVNLTDVDI